MQFYVCSEHHKKNTSIHFQFWNNSSQSTYFVIYHTTTKASDAEESWTITAFIISEVWVNFSKAFHLFSFGFTFLSIILQLFQQLDRFCSYHSLSWQEKATRSGTYKNNFFCKTKICLCYYKFIMSADLLWPTFLSWTYSFDEVRRYYNLQNHETTLATGVTELFTAFSFVVPCYIMLFMLLDK